MDGQFYSPVRVALDDFDVPPLLENFVDRHGSGQRIDNLHARPIGLIVLSLSGANALPSFKWLFLMDDIPETLELILWCAALVTWLVLLYRILREPYNSLSKAIRRLVVKAES